MDLTIIATLLGFVGHGFSIYKMRVCFAIWIVSAMIWIAYSLLCTWQPYLALNSFASIGFSGVAYYNWGRMENEND